MPNRADGTENGRTSPSIEGFTLAETLLAASIAVVILGGLMSVFTMSLRAWKEGSRDVSVQSSARLIMENIVRGPGGRFGLREAAEEDITIDQDGRGICFLVDKNTPPTVTKSDDTSVKIYFEDGTIMYDPSTDTSWDETPIVRHGMVEDVQFQMDGRAVNVQLRMAEISGTTRPSQIKLQTKVFLRKSENPDTET
jgi:type II secretory pathway pseudopilin PulG